jgi:hypothetical protein
VVVQVGLGEVLSVRIVETRLKNLGLPEYGPLFREGLGLWEAVPAARVHRGSSGDQTHGGACRMERFILGHDVPDGLGQLAGKIDAGDLGAALAAEPLFRDPRYRSR